MELVKPKLGVPGKMECERKPEGNVKNDRESGGWDQRSVSRGKSCYGEADRSRAWVFYPFHSVRSLAWVLLLLSLSPVEFRWHSRFGGVVWEGGQEVWNRSGGPRTSLVVQWLRLSASTAGGRGSVPGWGSCMCNMVGPKNKLVN